MGYKLRKGYIIGPGLQDPAHDIYEADIFKSKEDVSAGNVFHTSESEWEAEIWIDGESELGSAQQADVDELNAPMRGEGKQMAKKAVCNICGAAYTDQPSIEMVEKWKSEGDGYAPCPNISCTGQMRIVEEGNPVPRVERYGGAAVRVAGVDVLSTTVAGKWAVNYIVVTPGEVDEYRNALMKAHVTLIKVIRCEGLIVFED